MERAGSTNSFSHIVTDLPGHGKYFSLKALNDPRVDKLPYSIRVILEAALRCCDEFEVTSKDVENILDWENQTSSGSPPDIVFKPARVLLQDFTGVPALVDLAAMRDAMVELKGDPSKINPLVPVDLVIDHSVQVDFSRNSSARHKNEEMEFNRNFERFSFIKWGAASFKNMLVVPPASGIVHQVNLEYLARCVFKTGDILHPDSVVGTDSHTTMIDGLGVVGWGVGGIEAEAVMLGQAISMVLPEVVGFKIFGQLNSKVTATDLVLVITQMLRKRNVVGKFVEFFGEGCKLLSLADRATIANMSPEYGATMGYFPFDCQSINYLKQTGRSPDKIQMIEDYLRAQGLYREYNGSQADPNFSGPVLELDLNMVVPCIAGPKRPQDRIQLADAKSVFLGSLSNRAGFQGFGLSSDELKAQEEILFEGKKYTLRHGSVVIAAITSCTNTSNPDVMLGAALIAKRAIEKGLAINPYIKTSLSPGSTVVVEYLKLAGLLPYLEQLKIFVTGLGCQTCIGNSGDLDNEVSDAINSKNLVVASVLSGNRNFEGRVHPQTRANYLASPMLVIAYALAGRVDIDFTTEPLGVDASGKNVFLDDVWPEKSEIQDVVKTCVLPKLFTKCYETIKTGNKRWNELAISKSELYGWDDKSTYIHQPPFFNNIKRTPDAIPDILEARCLLNLGDSVTTDHISPAGKVSNNSPAAKYLNNKGVVDTKQFNSYGARRGNDEIMARGTFANIRLINKLASNPGPITTYLTTGEEMPVFDVVEAYAKEGTTNLIILAGKEYGSGSSRDWAAKGPKLLNVKAVIAQTFERIHRSNLVGMGILPLQFKDNENADSFHLSGKEVFTIPISKEVLEKPRASVTVSCHSVQRGNVSFIVESCIYTEVELEYFRNGGILNYVLRQLV